MTISNGCILCSSSSVMGIYVWKVVQLVKLVQVAISKCATLACGGTVCSTDEDWDEVDAIVACRQLEYAELG